VLGRLASFSFRRRRLVVLLWVLGAIALSGIGWGAVGPNFRTDFSLPDSETKQVFEFLEARSPDDAGITGQIVFQAGQGVDDPAVTAAMSALFDRVDQLPDVRVTSPYAPDGAFQINPDRTIAFATVDLSGDGLSLPEAQEKSEKIVDLGRQVDVPGLRIEFGGEVFYKFTMPAAEAIGLLAAAVILLVAFGSVLAMGLPLATALAGLVTALAAVALSSNWLSMPEFTTAMAAMIGLGVGIDYALFIVTRYREGTHAGLDAHTAVVDAIDTAGRAVLFAGGTVVISLLGLFLAGLGFVRGLAVASVLAVLLMVAASLTLLPALIAMAGSRIEITTWRGAIGLLVPVLLTIPAIIFEIPALALAGLALGVVVVVASFFVPKLRQPVPPRRVKPREQTFWYRWSRTIQRRPWTAAISGLAVLVVLAVPLFAIRLGFSDPSSYPQKETARRAYDLLAQGFGPGFNGPLLVLARTDGQIDPQALDAVVETIQSTEGVAVVVPPRPLGDDASLITVFATSAPSDEATGQLVQRLRDGRLAQEGLQVQVGGLPTIAVDFAGYLAQRLPIIVGAVLVLSFLLLMVVFRSVLVPLKAVIMNLLSIGAAYGATVAIFQWGWARWLVGIEAGGPIDAWAPMMLFAIVFGLSMDYEVFLLSRIKEEYDRTGDNATAVADGLALTARVITAAALIMFCVFASFILGDDRQLKVFGFGLAVAVILDATLVRMVLVPATMELLGDRNWWLPRWLDRILPVVHVEGRSRIEANEAAGEPPSGERELVKVGS
jgi:RND superfamily putative drug exporter